ncbi:lantibiotic dehydratase [Streptomyces europaeiscabiei]|uniref:lantibiotic dehydratase n=1 Tax=Streptomyces europaeiscabiei TaxID=146819 RepID=UPI0029BB9436|nr:lantibiotic dehydratase [Streptomyces europaeiscabiei]MDX3588258.1 lantibiotic dehydratase [Streptomyces europaeiscabiei]
MYRAIDASMIRASVFPLAATLPAWPDLDGEAPADVERWRNWIAQVWADDTRAASIDFAAPLLATAIRDGLDGERQRPRTVRRTAASLARYLLRMQHRATPFGLFAGPAPVSIGGTARVTWGKEHRAFARADAEWLNIAITALEGNREVLRRLPVVADPTCTIRGNRVAVPHQSGTHGPTDTTLRRTRAVEAVLTLARTPIMVGDLVGKLHGAYPDTPTAVIEDMVSSLVAHRVLLTSLHAPMTCDDALGHLIAQLDATSAAATSGGAEAVVELRKIHQLLTLHDIAAQGEQQALRVQAAARMNTLTDTTTHTLVVNVRPDCDIVLPTAVTREAERALKVVSRISPYPNGSPAWQDYRARFLERYSMGAIVSLRDLTDPDTGLGFPVGYRGTVLKRPVLATTRRDDHLLALAQSAAFNDRRGVALTEENIKAMSLGEPTQVPAHVELCFTVLSPSLEDLEHGRFHLVTAGLSLAAGTTTGRFLTMLDQSDRDRMTAEYAALPTLAAGAVRGQVSSPPLRIPTRNVGCAPAVVPHVLSVGEYNPDATLDLDDLGVVADSRCLYLLSLSTGQFIEPSVMNAVELSSATHPLVRFVTEMHRSHTAILTPFAWGAAARLPFLPEVRVGRTILSAACWRLNARDLSDDSRDWMFRFTDWRIRYGVPRTVYVGGNDQRLRLDLDISAHRQLLRAELDRHRTVTLHEAPDEAAFGWVGRAHEITVSFASDQPPSLAPINRTATVVRHDSSRLPGAGEWAYLKLYGNADRAPELLTSHLPSLLHDWDADARTWWFTRYNDPDSHLRLRLRLPNPNAFGEAAQHVAAWADELRAEGLLQRVQWDTDEPETGRYGTGPALTAAEQVFVADSAAALAQIALPIPDRLWPAVTAASFVDIADAFLGSPTDGRAWLTTNLLKNEGGATTRDVLAAAVRLSSPGPDHAAMRALPNGEHLVTTWARRRTALTAYRQALETHGADPAAVLPSLLHMHHNRVAGIDPDSEAICRRLARAAALSWTAREEGALR